MTPEIPPAHREAVRLAVWSARAIGEGLRDPRDAEPITDAAIATLLQLGYRVAPGWVATEAHRPPVGVDVLVEMPDGQRRVAEWNGLGFADGFRGWPPARTRWMPLPPVTTQTHTTTDKGE